MLFHLDLSKDNVTAEDATSLIADEDFDLVEKLLSNEQKANLHQALRRSKSTPPIDPIPPSAEKPPLERFLSNVSTPPPEFPMRKADSLENVALDESVTNVNEKGKLLQQVVSMKNKIIFFKTQNKELHKSLERSNTLLHEERKQRLSERSLSSSSLRDSITGDYELHKEQLPLRTIAELTVSGRGKDSLFRPRLSGSFIVDDEASQKREMYGQRKSSISLDEMYDLFDVDRTTDSHKKTFMPVEN